MLRPNLINVATVAIIAIAAYVVVIGGLRAFGVNVPYVTQ